VEKFKKKNLRKGRPLQGLHGRIMLNLILDMSKWDGRMRTEFIWLRKPYSIESWEYE
jgi:hypothetical protein